MLGIWGIQSYLSLSHPILTCSSLYFGWGFTHLCSCLSLGNLSLLLMRSMYWRVRRLEDIVDFELEVLSNVINKSQRER